MSFNGFNCHNYVQKMYYYETKNFKECLNKISRLILVILKS